MRITLNNEAYEVPGMTKDGQASCTVKNLLALKSWSFPLIIVKINGILVPRESWDSTYIQDGDTVEAIHLVSGG